MNPLNPTKPYKAIVAAVSAALTALLAYTDVLPMWAVVVVAVLLAGLSTYQTPNPPAE